MRVNTGELERQAMEMRCIAARLNDIESSVICVSRILNQERFGERFRSSLASAAGSIMRRAEELNKMSTGLRQISQLYEKTETRIVDEADHANVHHDSLPFGIIQIPSWIIRPIGPVYPRLINPVVPDIPREIMEMPNSSLDDIPIAVMPNPDPDVSGIEGMLREMFANLSDGNDIFSEATAPLSNSSDGSSLIDWTPWEP